MSPLLTTTTGPFPFVVRPGMSCGTIRDGIWTKKFPDGLLDSPVEVVTVTAWLPPGASAAMLNRAFISVELAELMTTEMPVPALTVGLVPNPLPRMMTSTGCPMSARIQL